MSLQILFRDEHYIAIHKPANILVHRSWLASRDRRFVLQELRDQIGQRVYPVHRLDRATSGVLIFALTPAAGQRLSARFEAGEVAKDYLAVVRGWADTAGVIDHPVRDRDQGGAPREAVSRYRRLARIELPFAVDRYPSSRYSLVAVQPQTGRRHQIRQHFKHLSHPLLGDTTYGNGRHNRFFREHFAIHRLLLLARQLAFEHPDSGERIVIGAAPEPDWSRLLSLPDWQWEPGERHPLSD